MNILTRNCKICDKSFGKTPNIGMPDWLAGKRKYCSTECQHKSLIGNEWNKGKPAPWAKHLPQQFKKGEPKPKNAYVFPKDELHPQWKGDRVSYDGLHRWIANKKGRPKKCEQCKTTKAKKYEWANKDHKYSRNLEDWMRLCTSCHRKYDIENNNYKVKGHGRK